MVLSKQTEKSMRDLSSISGKGLGVVCYFMRDFVRDFLGNFGIM